MVTPLPPLFRQIGSLVACISSDDARQVTGGTFTIDGGWTAQ